MEISIEIPGVKLGVLEAEGLRVELVVAALAGEMDAVCERIRSGLRVEQVSEQEPVQAVRAMFHAWGVDPTRYRPSSEALLRRVAQGKGLYRISNVVDICNLGSIETGWPYGLYDAAALVPPITLRLGRAGESFQRIGRETWHLAGHAVLVDQQGPFGSPISDSVRTMITEATVRLLLVIFAPAGAPTTTLDHALQKAAARLSQYASARITATALLSPK